MLYVGSEKRLVRISEGQAELTKLGIEYHNAYATLSNGFEAARQASLRAVVGIIRPPSSDDEENGEVEEEACLFDDELSS